MIVPDDDELRTGIEKIERLENISIPSQWIREAKGRSLLLVNNDCKLFVLAFSEISFLTKRFSVRRCYLS